MEKRRRGVEPIKFVIAAIVAALGFFLGILGIDVFVHDQTVREALDGIGHHAWLALNSFYSTAWQYKVLTLIAIGIVVAIFYVRVVPEIKSQS